MEAIVKIKNMLKPRKSTFGVYKVRAYRPGKAGREIHIRYSLEDARDVAARYSGSELQTVIFQKLGNGEWQEIRN